MEHQFEYKKLTACISLLRQCQSHPRVGGMPLSFYLLKPVKRVTEYPLLVEKILKNTPEDHSDFVCIQGIVQTYRNLPPRAHRPSCTI